MRDWKSDTHAKRHITREHSDGRIVLIAHLPGGRSLTRNLPANHVRWAVRFAFVGNDVPLVDGDEQVLYDEAAKAGRPLYQKETRAILLERRLAPK